MKPEHLSASEQLALREGDAPVAQRERWSQHVAECASCRDGVAALDWMDETLNAWHAPEPPSDGLARVLQRIGSQQREAPPPVSLRVAAATLVGVTLGARLIALGAARLLAVPAVVQLELATPWKSLAAMGLAALVFFGVGSLLALTLAPVLLLEGQARPASRSGLGRAGQRAWARGFGGGSQS